jgi:hypothetical protein
LVDREGELGEERWRWGRFEKAGNGKIWWDFPTEFSFRLRWERAFEELFWKLKLEVEGKPLGI